MTEDEVDVVAAELAKAGGVSWYPGRERGPLKVVSHRYRDRARLAIAALDRYRASQQGTVHPDDMRDGQHEPSTQADRRPGPDDALLVGSTVLYRPPGDRRAYPCQVEKIDGSRAYLVADTKPFAGWVDVASLSSAAASETSETGPV
jgi:hypothetical protein